MGVPRICINRNHGKEYVYVKIDGRNIYIAPKDEPEKVNIENLLMTINLLNRDQEKRFLDYQQTREYLLPLLKHIYKNAE